MYQFFFYFVTCEFGILPRRFKERFDNLHSARGAAAGHVQGQLFFRLKSK